MNEFVAVTSTNIAKILNCYPKKGAILVGSDADIVVWDPEKEKTITAGSQQSSIDYNVFEGKHVKGLPRYTLSRGYVSVEDGEIKTREGHGEFVKREPGGTVNKALSSWKETYRSNPSSTHRHTGKRGIGMAARLQYEGKGRFKVHPKECVSPEGRRLAELIDRNEHAMIQASLLGHPALSALLPLLTNQSVDALALNDSQFEDGNALMQAFGHMVRLEMNFLGFFQVGEERKKTNWPFGDRDSRLAVFRRNEHGASE